MPSLQPAQQIASPSPAPMCSLPLSLCLPTDHPFQPTIFTQQPVPNQAGFVCVCVSVCVCSISQTLTRCARPRFQNYHELPHVPPLKDTRLQPPSFMRRRLDLRNAARKSRRLARGLGCEGTPLPNAGRRQPTKHLALGPRGKPWVVVSWENRWRSETLGGYETTMSRAICSPKQHNKDTTRANQFELFFDFHRPEAIYTYIFTCSQKATWFRIQLRAAKSREESPETLG